MTCPPVSDSLKRPKRKPEHGIAEIYLCTTRIAAFELFPSCCLCIALADAKTSLQISFLIPKPSAFMRKE
jgi:hypothetical protein